MDSMKLLRVVAIATPLVASSEGLREYAYLDPIGIPTICFGETRGVHMGDYKSKEECTGMLQDRLKEFTEELDNCIPEDAPDKSYSAFLSLAYNVGAHSVCKSSIPKKLKEGKIISACNTIRSFRKPPLPGLLKRRNEETKLCLEGINDVD